MFINSIHLKNFRNISEQRIAFGPKFNLLIGANAQGKTNVVEAAYLFATGRSFRTSEFRDMKRWKTTTTDIRANTSGDIGSDELRVLINDTKKEYFRNAKKARPGGQKRLGAVLFAPEEILLLRKAPADRRRYVDLLISQVYPTHRTITNNFSKIVTQRNRILQDFDVPGNKRAELLTPWNHQLAECGAKLIVERARWLKKLNELIPTKYSSIAPCDGEARLEYRPHCGNEAVGGGEAAVRARLGEQIEGRCSDELRRGVTLVGPNRDDFEAVIGDTPVKQYGSQGQHRTFVLALKIAEIDFKRREMGELPALLLDDVASELDSERIRFLFEYLRRVDGQVFITATSEDDVKMLPDKDVHIFDVHAGKIAPRK